nr:transposase [Aquibacillus sediminis]
MKFMLMISSIILPIIMVILQRKWNKIQVLFHVLAIISALIFGNIAAIAIYTIIQDGTVFMTNIHGLFLNPFFLMTGAYLGLFTVYRMILKLAQIV